jgi:hypothetical protein
MQFTDRMPWCACLTRLPALHGPSSVRQRTDGAERRAHSASQSFTVSPYAVFPAMPELQLLSNGSYRVTVKASGGWHEPAADALTQNRPAGGGL